MLLTERLSVKTAPKTEEEEGGLFARTSLLQLAQAVCCGLAKDGGDLQHQWSLFLVKYLLSNHLVLRGQEAEWTKSQILSKAIFGTLFVAVKSDKAVVSVLLIPPLWI